MNFFRKSTDIICISDAVLTLCIIFIGIDQSTCEAFGVSAWKWINVGIKTDLLVSYHDRFRPTCYPSTSS